MSNLLQDIEAQIAGAKTDVAREGDRQTGKTAIAIDTIINQKGTDVAGLHLRRRSARSSRPSRRSSTS